MAAKKSTKKDKTPKLLYVPVGKYHYGDQCYKTVDEAFEDSCNTVDVYQFVKHQRIVVKVEDI